MKRTSSITLFISAKLNSPVAAPIASCAICFVPVLFDFTERVPLLQKLQEARPIFMLYMNGVFTTVKIYMGIQQPDFMILFNLCLICLFYFLISNTTEKHQVMGQACTGFATRNHVYRLFKVSPISPSIQIARSWISGGQYASERLMQIYAAFGFWKVIFQNGYFMITGVLPPTPNSKYRMCNP